MARRRRNPSKKAVVIGLGTVAIAGGVLWYLFGRKKAPAPMLMAVPTAAQRAATPSNPMTAAAMSSLTSLATQLQTAAK